MKKFFSGLVLGLMAFSPLALAENIAPYSEPVSIVGVEILKPVVEVDGLKINLIQVDNGGSSDVSAAESPSSLYLTFFVEGEEYNTEAIYRLYDNATKLYDVTYEPLTQTATFLVELAGKISAGGSTSSIVKGTVKLTEAIREAQVEQPAQLSQPVDLEEELAGITINLETNIETSPAGQ